MEPLKDTMQEIIEDLRRRTIEPDSSGSGDSPELPRRGSAPAARIGIPRRYIEASFASYQAPTPGQAAALTACQQFSADWTGRGGMLLLGRCGTGKTHLACAILHAVGAAGPERWVLRYRTVMQALRTVKSTWRAASDESEADALRALIRPDVLVLDEIGVQFGTEAERLILTEMINERYNECRPTVLAGNLTLPELLGVIGERALDRVCDRGQVVVFDWASYRAMDAP